MFGLRVAGIFLLAGMGVQGADYVGSAACKTCHPDVWNNFYKNPHYKSIAAGKPDGPDTGCESCHGPGKAHIDAKGGKATVVAFIRQCEGEEGGRYFRIPLPRRSQRMAHSGSIG